MPCSKYADVVCVSICGIREISAPRKHANNRDRSPAPHYTQGSCCFSLEESPTSKAFDELGVIHVIALVVGSQIPNKNSLSQQSISERISNIYLSITVRWLAGKANGVIITRLATCTCTFTTCTLQPARLSAALSKKGCMHSKFHKKYSSTSSEETQTSPF